MTFNKTSKSALILLAVIIFFNLLMLKIVDSVTNYKTPNNQSLSTDKTYVSGSYGELKCLFQKIENGKVFVEVDEKTFYYDIDSPYKFMGLEKGTEITLKIPRSPEAKIVLDIDDGEIFMK